MNLEFRSVFMCLGVMSHCRKKIKQVGGGWVQRQRPPSQNHVNPCDCWSAWGVLFFLDFECATFHPIFLVLAFVRLLRVSILRHQGLQPLRNPRHFNVL